jgi:hypothetical protein
MAVTVESLALEVARAFEPLKDRLAAGEVRTLFAELGMPAPDTVLAAPGVLDAIGDTASAVGDLPSKIEDLVEAIEEGDVAPIVVALAALTPVIASVTATVDRIGDAVDGAASGAATGEIQAFAAALPERLVGYLVAHYLERRHPVVAGIGELLGLVERRAVAATAAAPAYVERRLRLDLLGDLLNDPLARLAENYQWGGALRWEDLLDRLARFANSVAKVAFVQPGPGGGPPVLRIFMVDLGPTDDTIPGIRASARVDLERKLDIEIPLRPGLALDVGLAGDLNAGAAIDLLPPGELRVDPPPTTAQVSGRARIGVAATGVGGAPVTLLGIAGGSGLQAQKLRASIGSDLDWDVGSGKATGDVLIEVAVEDGAVVIDLSGADGFLSAILPDGGLRVPFDLLAGWSSTRGLYFEGGAGLAIDIPIDVELGPIKLQLLHLGFTVSPDGLTLEASGAVGAKLGPFALAVERMGTTAALTFPEAGGNLGPADLDFAFKPPSGIGLALDAGVVKGGGYLYLDPDKGEYAGILELSFGPVSIKAIGILTTKLPGGGDGWALLLLVFGEFSAVQLGFGFTLNGVGGIIGLQHGVSIDALQSGLRTGVLDSVLFPRDPVANAPTLIGQLRVVFPIVPRALTVGPALKLGWSTPALVTLSLGIILQFDDVLGSGPGSPSFTRVVLLGQLKVQVPPVDELGIDAPALIHLQVDILGAYDVPEQALSVDAVLRDSHVALLPITGSLVVRARFGADPTFILAVGGFHPRFTDLPPGIPPQDRVGLQLDYGIVTVRIVGYVAITSNTFQTGAEASLVAAGGGFRVEAYIGFDALFIFEPVFHFEIDFRVGASVRYKSISLASLKVRGVISGPGRWEVEGHASISLFFFDVDIDFEVGWGEAAAPALPGVKVIEKIVTALSAPESWHAELPGSNPMVTLRTVAAGTDVLAHPLSSLVGVQKVVPLGIDISRVGKSVPTDGNHFDITSARVGTGGGETVGFRDEHFARGEYLDLTEEEKLSTPSFERFRAGVTVATDDYSVPASAVVFEPQWETLYLRQDEPPERHLVPAKSLVLQAALGAVAQSGIHADRGLTATKSPVSVGASGFTVASATSDVTVASGFGTFTEAFQASAKATGTTYVADLAEREVRP